MDNNGIPAEPGLRYLAHSSIRINMCPAEFAVTVSKISAEQPKPRIEEVLSPDYIPANYVPSIMFTCTHWKGGPPTFYPFGTLDGQFYHRLKMRLEDILSGTILYIPKNSKVGNARRGNVEYFDIEVARTDEEKKYWSQQDDYEVLDTSKKNDFIYFDETLMRWFCNNYSDCLERYFVYLVFSSCLRPTYKRFWDTVKKTKEWTERGPDQRYGNDPAFQEFEYR